MFNPQTFFRQLQSNLRRNLKAMASPPNADMSARSSTPTQGLGDPKRDGVEHAPAADALQAAKKQLCTVKSLDIQVSKNDSVKKVPAYLHLPQNYHREASEGREKTAAILLSGAGGGLVGPSSIYLSMADKLASLNRGIPVLRMDYRFPARNKYCVPDVLAAMDYLQNGFAVSRFVLVGWSFGGAPVFTVGGQDERVVGCATVASQTAETDGIRQVGTKSLPLLLLHGTGDRTLSSSCSQSLYEKYHRHARGDEGEIRLFDGDDHALSKSAGQAETLLCDFIMKCAGETVSEDEHAKVVEKPLVDDGDRVQKMKEGGDLRGGESVE